MQKENKVEIEIKYPEINDDITILKKILLPVEFSILKTLIKADKPLSTREIYVENILFAYRDYLEERRIEEEALNESIKTTEIDLAQNRMNLVGMSYGQDTTKEKEIQLEVLNKKKYHSHGLLEVDKEIKLFDFKHLKGRFNTENVRKMEAELRKKKMKFPSYLLVQKSTETLISWGFITKRWEETSKNASHFLILNPLFLMKYNKELNKLLEL